MAESSRPWAGTTIGDAGPYSAEEWADTWARAVADAGHRANAGVLLSSGNSNVRPLNVQESSPTAATVRIRPGAALVQGIYYKNSSDLTLSIAANASGNPRIDLVVLRIDYTAQTVRAAVKQGTPAGSPVRPNLTQVVNTTWEIPLGEIAVANGFVTISDAVITNYPEYVNGAGEIIHEDVLNNSGQELKTGDVVVWDSTGKYSVTVSTDIYKAAGRTAGVWIGLTANGERGRLLARGPGYVNMNAAVGSRLQAISLHSVAKQAAVGVYATFAISLETTGGAGLCLCYVDCGNEFISPTLMARVNISPAQSIPNAGAVTAVTNWANGAYISDARMHSDSVNPGRLYMPRRGLWRIFVNIDMAAVDGTYRAMRLLTSGGATILEQRYSVAAGQLGPQISTDVYITADNDYVTVSVFHDGPAARQLNVLSWASWYFVGDIL